MKKTEKEKLKKELDKNYGKALEELDEAMRKLRNFLSSRLMTELQLFYILTEEED